MKIAPRFLRTTQSEEALKSYLGGSLARWLFSKEARARCSLERPQLPDRAGSGVGILVFGKGDYSDALAKAFLLPFQWKKDSPDSKSLPGNVSQIAETVREATASADSENDILQSARNYGLYLRIKERNLSQLNIQADSCFAPLAASLWVLLHGGDIDRHVFSTGIWRGNGIEGVESIEEKTKAVIEMIDKDHGADRKKKPVFFVPDRNFFDAQDADSNDRLDIRRYPAGKEELSISLKEHLNLLHAPPVKGENQSEEDYLDEKIAYANQPYVSPDKPYYIEHLLEGLAGRIRQASALLEENEIDELVLFVSYNYELALLIAKTIRPKHVTLLFSEETKKHSESIFKKLDEWGIDHSPPEPLEKPSKHGWSIDTENRIVIENAAEEALLHPLKNWLDGKGKAILEVTAGNKIATLILAQVSIETGKTLCYIHHKFKNRKTVYGHERLEVIDWIGRSKRKESRITPQA